MAQGVPEFDLLDWDLYQVLAWIMDRREGLEAIRGQLEDVVVAIFNDRPEEIAQAYDALVDVLRRGKLICYGRLHLAKKEDFSISERQPVPSSDWTDLRLEHNPPKAWVPHHGAGAIWRDLSFPSKQVRKVWPLTSTEKRYSEFSKGGRPKGSGSIDDSQRISEMRRLLNAGEVKSRRQAALTVIERDDTYQSLTSEGQEAAVHRLLRKYAAEHGRAR